MRYVSICYRWNMETVKLAYLSGRRARPRAVQLAFYSFYCSQQSEKKGWGKGLQLVRLEPREVEKVPTLA